MPYRHEQQVWNVYGWHGLIWYVRVNWTTTVRDVLQDMVQCTQPRVAQCVRAILNGTVRLNVPLNTRVFGKHEWCVNTQSSL